MVEDICTHVLVLNSGRRKFFGELDELRKRFQVGDDKNIDASSLEQAFFSALSEVEDALSGELNTSSSNAAVSNQSASN